MSKQPKASPAKGRLAQISELPSPWKPAQTRQEERDQKREAILRTAAALFLQQGYDRASLNDVAGLLSISKPTLYIYFASKDAILVEVYRYGFQIASSAIDAAMAETTGLERVRAFIRGYSRIMTQDFGMCLVRINFRVLPAEDQSRVAAERGRIDRAVRSFIEQGISDGSIEPCDAKFKSLAIFGAMHWIGEWYSPDGPLGPDEIAEKFVEALTAGLSGVVRAKPLVKRPAQKR